LVCYVERVSRTQMNPLMKEHVEPV